MAYTLGLAFVLGIMSYTDSGCTNYFENRRISTEFAPEVMSDTDTIEQILGFAIAALCSWDRDPEKIQQILQFDYWDDGMSEMCSDILYSVRYRHNFLVIQQILTLEISNVGLPR